MFLVDKPWETSRIDDRVPRNGHDNCSGRDSPVKGCLPLWGQCPALYIDRVAVAGERQDPSLAPEDPLLQGSLPKNHFNVSLKATPVTCGL